MKCTNCKKDKEVVHRTEPKGQPPKWMCEPCIEILEPELFKNILEDKSAVIPIIQNDNKHGFSNNN